MSIKVGIWLWGLLALAFGEKMRNIDYLSFGYNLYKGNPFSTNSGVDPGFQIQQLFDFKYDEHQISSDGRWEIPDHTTVVREDSCTLDFHSSAISGTESYSHTLETSVSGSIEGWGAKFRASVDYKSVEERTSHYKELYTVSKGECKIYTGKINTYLPPKLSENFIAAINSLPEEYDEGAYMGFLDNFGTHFVEQVHMGARFSCVTRMLQQGWTSLLQKGIKVDIAASYSAFGVTGALDIRTEEQKKMAREFDSVRTDMQLSIVGSKPVKDHDVTEWARQVIEEPMPMRYTITLLSDLLTPHYVQDAKIIKNLAVLRANLITATANYCAYLQRRSLIPSCQTPSPDPPFPKVVNSCRFCLSRCGNSFTVNTGGYTNAALNDQQPILQYAPDCKLPFAQHNFKNDLARVCCQEEDADRIGTCRMCLSCGDDYPEDVGYMHYKLGIPVAFSYDDRCHGELRLHDPKTVPHFCCKRPAVCSVCRTCGGEYPEEVGLLHNYKISFVLNELYFGGRGPNCQGHEEGARDFGKLCCKNKGISLEQHHRPSFNVALRCSKA